jgi:hypothetical protein
VGEGREIHSAQRQDIEVVRSVVFPPTTRQMNTYDVYIMLRSPHLPTYTKPLCVLHRGGLHPTIQHGMSRCVTGRKRPGLHVPHAGQFGV